MDKMTSVPPPDLFSRTMRGGIWVFVTRVFMQILSMAKTVILARMLLPSEFGVLGIAMLSIDALTTFTQTGFIPALIQKKDNVEEYIHSAWTVSVVRGILLCLILYFASPYLVLFFDSSGQFDAMDFPKPYELSAKIASDPNSLNQYIFTSLSESAKEKIKSANVPLMEMKAFLAGEFNVICEKESIYAPQRFSGISLSDYAKLKIIDKQEPRLRLNRLLLEEAFPGEIKKRVMDIPQTTAVLRVMSMLFLVYGLNNSRLFQLTRNLNFDKSFYLQGSQTFFGLCFTIAMAFWLRNVWALVWGQLFSAVLGCILGYVLVPNRPRWDFNWHKARQLWSFGKHISRMEILTFLVGRGDSFFVGKILGVVAMGYYRYAIQIIELTTQEFSGMIMTVSFPVFSQIQNNLTKIRNGYHKTLEMANLVGFYINGMVLILAPNIIEILLGVNWLPIISVVRILSLLGFVSALGQARSVFLGINRPDIQMKLILLRIGILLFLLYPLTKIMGIEGTAIAMVISRYMTVPATFYWTRQLIQSGFTDFFKTIRISGTAMILMASIVWPLQQFSNTASIPHLLGLVGLGTAIYFFVDYLLDKRFNEAWMFNMLRDSIVAAMKKTQKD